MANGVDIKKIGEQSLALWKKLTPVKKAALATVLVLAAGGIAAVSLIQPEKKEAVLFSGMAAEDAGPVLEQLAQLKIPYRLEHSGTTVLVPEEKVHELRIQMASAGLPRGGGIGFEVFDKQSFNTTTFVEQMNYNRALSGELSRSISSIAAVERARVHIALPERSLYTQRDESPSASIVVRLRPGRELAPQQIRGIVHLAASSVPRLQPDRVTLVDEGGTVLWSGDDGLTGGSGSQHDLEKTLAGRVTEIIDRIVGPGRSVVVVTAELDTARTERTEELFDKDRLAIRSESRTEERSGNGSQGVGGLAGVRGNLPDAPAPEATAQQNDNGKLRLSETRNYEVNRIVSKTLGPKVQVKKLHVAILVDGVVTSSTGGQIERPEKELARIASLAREAAGLDENRGDRLEIHSVPFYAPATEEQVAAPAPVQPWKDPRFMWIAIGGGAFLLLALIATLFFLRRKKESVEPMELPALPLTASEVEDALTGVKPKEPALPTPRELAMLAARTDAQRAAQVVAAWLSEPVAVQEVNR